MTETESHVHKYTTYEYQRVMDIQQRKEPYHYTGDVGEMAFIYHVCDCGKKQASDYGRWQEIKDKYDKLTEVAQ